MQRSSPAKTSTVSRLSCRQFPLRVSLAPDNLPTIWECSSSLGKQGRLPARCDSVGLLGGVLSVTVASAVALGRLIRTGASASEATVPIDWWPGAARAVEPPERDGTSGRQRSGARPDFILLSIWGPAAAIRRMACVVTAPLPRPALLCFALPPFCSGVAGHFMCALRRPFASLDSHFPVCGLPRPCLSTPTPYHPPLSLTPPALPAPTIHFYRSRALGRRDRHG